MNSQVQEPQEQPTLEVPQEPHEDLPTLEVPQTIKYLRTNLGHRLVFM